MFRWCCTDRRTKKCYKWGTFQPDTDRMKSLTSKERRGCAEVSLVKLDVIGPLLPSSQTPWCPPAVVVKHSSPVMILPDFYAQHAALRADWGKQKHNQAPQQAVTLCLDDFFPEEMWHPPLSFTSQIWLLLVFMKINEYSQHLRSWVVPWTAVQMEIWSTLLPFIFALL